MNILGVDIGGTGIKAALVDTERGELVSERIRIPTPASLMPNDVIPAVLDVIKQFNYQGPIGLGFPAVVANGVPVTSFTARGITEWISYPVQERLSQLTGCPVTVLNDADAAGLAEMRFGAGRDKLGTVILLTLGTGIGSAVFINGHLLPNTEFGRIYLKGHIAYVEQYAAESVRIEQDIKWKEWAERLDQLLLYLEMIFTPSLFIIGGGAIKKQEKFLPRLTVRTPLVAAQFANQAGIVGAALAARAAIQTNHLSAAL